MLFRLSHATPHFYLLIDLSTTYLPSYLSLSWASLIAQLVKNPSAMQETWVQFLGWGDPLGEGKGYPLLYSGLENSIDRIVRGVAKSRTRLNNFNQREGTLEPKG